MVVVTEEGSVTSNNHTTTGDGDGYGDGLNTGDGSDSDGEELDNFENDDDEDDEFPVSVFGVEEKKRLEKQREARRLSIQEKESLRESRVIFFRMKEQMSPEQLRRIRLVMGKLIALSPPVSDDRSKLAKAFVVWSEKLPLYLKCNELRHQFDERGIALEVLRDSYYRDVLSVKLHMERIYKNQDMPLELKELCGSVPSMDFRKLVQRSHSENSSNLLRDNLMSTNLVSQEVKNKWGINPWEQGHAYQVYKRVNPERLRTGGASLNLYAPNRHRLYIKYCRSCVGVMSLVNDWNKDVEHALAAKMTKDTNDELRKVIQNLNSVIIELTKKLNNQTEAIETYDKGSKWWTEWAKKQTVSTEAELKIKQLRVLFHRWEDTARMSQEDQAAMKLVFDLYKVDATEKHNQLQTKLEEVTAAGEETGAELNNEIDSLKQEVKEREQKQKEQADEIERLKWEKQKLTDDNHRLKRLNAQLNSSLDEKDRQMAQYREETINRIENLTTQIDALNTDLENQELENDRIADLLETERLEAMRAKEEMEALKIDVARLQDVISKKDETIGKLETSLAEAEAEVSDDESEGITEEILEDYKDALQLIPKAMRNEVAKNLELFGFDDLDGDIDMDLLDSVLDGEGAAGTAGDEPFRDDDFSFQQISRRVSDAPTPAQTKQPPQPKPQPSQIEHSTSLPKIEEKTRQPSQSDLLLAKYSTVVSVQKNVRSTVVSAATPLPITTQSSSAATALATQTPLSCDTTTTADTSTRIAVAPSDAKSGGTKQKQQMIKQKSMSAVGTSARGASFRKQTSLGLEAKKSPQRPLLRKESSPIASMVRGSRREMSRIQIFDDEQIAEMKEEGIRKAKLKKNIMQLIPVLAPFIKPNRKLTLKAVATAVRFLIRFKNAINTANFPQMGALGRREEVRRVHVFYEQYAAIIEHLEKKVQTFKNNEVKYKAQVESMADTIKKLREVNREHIKKAAAYADNMEHIQRDLTRQHIIGQCQRNFAAELSETLGVIRNRIFMMIKYEGDIPVPLKEEDAKKLEDTSMDFKEVTEEEEEKERILLEQRVIYLFRKLRLHVMDVSQFVQENKQITPINTFALGRFPDFHSFSSKFRNELRNLKLFKKRALSDLSIVEKRWVVKTLKVCTSETNYRDLYFSRLCPSCLEGRERGLDGSWTFKKKRNNDRKENGELGSGVSHSPKEIKALTDNIARRVREEVTAEFQAQLESMRQEAMKLQEEIVHLRDRVAQLEDLVADTEMVVDVLREEVADSNNKYAICKREVFVLRNAIQDSYRAIEENALQQQIDRESKWRGKGTQIACSVCAIRYEKEEHGHEGDLTEHVEATDRILYPRARRFYHRVQRVQHIEDVEKDKKKFAFAYAPHKGVEYDEPPTTIARHRANQSSASKDKSSQIKSKKGGVETNIGELELTIGPLSPSSKHPPSSSSKFSQMKNIPAGSSRARARGGGGGGGRDEEDPHAPIHMTKIHVSKVAALLQNDNKIANFKKLQNTNELLNMTSAETVHMFKLLGSASKNSLDHNKAPANKKSQRPISAPSHGQNR